MLHDLGCNKEYEAVYFTDENISHLLGFADAFGVEKEKAISDDKSLVGESDIEKKARKLVESPVNFATTIISNISRDSGWHPMDSTDNALLYLENYSNFLNNLGACKYIDFFDKQAKINFDVDMDENELANMVVDLYKYAEPDERNSVINALVKNLTKFLKIKEVPHDYIYYIEPIIKADNVVKLYYNCIYSSNTGSGGFFNCITYEFIFDPATLTFENALIELEKFYKGIEDWIKDNTVEKMP